MKKNLLIGLAALAAVTITSCQKDQVINQVPQEQAIEFGTYVGRDAQTKGNSVNLDVMQGSTAGFGVFAYYSDNADYDPNYPNTFISNYMDNQQVKYITSDWEYSPIKYWPNETSDKISFIAYYPWVENKALEPGTTNIQHTVANNVKSQVDLLWNKTTLNNQTKQNTTEKITFDFGHALSRIGFNVVACVDETTADGDGKYTPLDNNTKITVNSVTLSNAFLVTGNLNLNKEVATWTNTSGTQGFTLNTTNTNWKNSNNIIQHAEDAQRQLPQQLNGDDSYIMIIPNGSTTFNLTINYDVETTDPKLSTGKSTINNNITKSVTIDFAAGNAYTLNLVLGMTSVKIDASYDDWDESSTIVNLPENE
ncbi:MAG: fimbrillin family protein, partial [Bacteroidales bacterium]|nr:fimbrillin family protein [Bacteroidales bacterium]